MSTMRPKLQRIGFLPVLKMRLNRLSKCLLMNIFFPIFGTSFNILSIPGALFVFSLLTSVSNSSLPVTDWIVKWTRDHYVARGFHISLCILLRNRVVLIALCQKPIRGFQLKTPYEFLAVFNASAPCVFLFHRSLKILPICLQLSRTFGFWLFWRSIFEIPLICSCFFHLQVW